MAGSGLSNSVSYKNIRLCHMFEEANVASNIKLGEGEGEGGKYFLLKCKFYLS